MESLFDAAKELFGYNRENFFFDNELRLKREFQEQDMRVKQFILYREDVRDLTKLTTGKMDNYLLVALLELGCCFDLLVHGVLHVHGDPQQPNWLLWLYVIALAEAFLYLFLSAWFAIHASIVAHSFAVRLLTQYVRLPVPDKTKLDAARTFAAEFEGGGIERFWRLPVVGQQLDNLTRATEEQAGGPEVLTADVGLALASLSGQNPATTLKHVRLYRDLQNNWQAFDAYARACLALGTYTMVHAVAYYCIGYLVVKLHAPWPALGVSLILPTLAWLLIRLDIYFGGYTMVLGALALMFGPLLAWVATTLAVLPPHLMHRLHEGHTVLVPVSFVLHAALIFSIVFVARAERSAGGGDVALPTRFRTVLYLDVFGWLSRPQAGSAHRAEGQQSPESPAHSLPGMPSQVPPEPAADQPLPSQLAEPLRHETRLLVRYLQLEFEAWDSPGTAQSLKELPSLVAEVRSLREVFERIKEELARQDAASLPQDNVPVPNLWLRLNVEDSVGFFVNPYTGELKREAPEGAHLSDIWMLREHVQAVGERCTLLGSAGRRPQHSPSQGRPPTFSVSSSSSGAALPQRSPNTSRRSVGTVSATASSTLRRPCLSTDTGRSSLGSAEEPEEVPSQSEAQETRFGGQEAAQVEALDGGYSHSAATAQTFHPRRDGRSESRRPPGQVPWITFLSASVLVASVWLGGVVGGVGQQLMRNRPQASEAAGVVAGTRQHLKGRQVLSAERWPRRALPWRVSGVACHSYYGATLFVVERYAVHEVSLQPNGSAEVPLRAAGAIDACLAQAPGFLSRGIGSLSLECTLPGVCAALLLDVPGDRALRCSLPATSAGISAREQATQATQLALTPGCWTSLLALTPVEGHLQAWWGQSQPGNVHPHLTELRVVPGNRGHAHAVPHRRINVEVQPAQARPASLRRTVGSLGATPGTGVHAPQPLGRGVIGLSAGGDALRAWAHAGSQTGVGADRHLRPEGAWQLPSGRRWTGVCACGRHLYGATTTTGAGRTSGGRGPELWHFELPEELWPLGQGRLVCCTLRGGPLLARGSANTAKGASTAAREGVAACVFDRTRSTGSGAALHERVSGREQVLRAELFPGKGDQAAVFRAAKLRELRAQRRGVNTEAIPAAKFERAQQEAANKAPEHLKGNTVKRGRLLGDDADARVEAPKGIKLRTRRGRSGPVVIPASAGSRGGRPQQATPKLDTKPPGLAGKLMEEVLQRKVEWGQTRG